MSDHPRGLLDTSAVIDLDRLDLDDLPAQLAICAITHAELSAGPGAALEPDERARRQDRVQRVEATFEPLPFGTEEARAYGRIHAAVTTGRSTRRRFADLLIAATALANDLPLVTSNPDDYTGLDGLLTIVPVRPAPRP
ncbi:MAG: type II toxin-antitoxin system VapC family toxin [Mobilicoccus sp.]|nr:type II toxin-antitoxin system VapC family toxin [Mobilicoccus sp.]